MNSERVSMLRRRKDGTILTLIFDMSFPFKINFDNVEKVEPLLRVCSFTPFGVTEL